MKTKITTLFLLLFMIITSSCKTKNKPSKQIPMEAHSQEENEEDLIKETAPPDSERWIREGYTRGVLIESKVKDCAWLIKTTDGILYPINLSENFPVEVNRVVWINYSFSKIAVDACVEGRPIHLKTIEIGED